MNNQPLILFTSAIISKHEKEREAEYFNSYQNLLTFIPESQIQVIECYLTNDLYFRNPIAKYAKKIFYSNTHNPYIRNKGVLEAKGLIEFFNKTKISDDQVCIKLTGRYYMMESEFIEASKKHDACYTTDSHNQAFTGCIAMRARLFKEFLLNLDLDQMERDMINIEFLAARFLEKKSEEGFSVHHMKPIHVWSKINNESIVCW